MRISFTGRGVFSSRSLTFFFCESDLVLLDLVEMSRLGVGGSRIVERSVGGSSREVMIIVTEFEKNCSTFYRQYLS